MPSDTAVPTVLMLCTGNICRSAAAERVLTLELGDAAPIRIRSAGFGAVVGSSIDPHVAWRLEEIGASTRGFTARQATPQLIREATLVLTATRDHRSRTVQMAPAAVRRSFTLREFARLIAESDMDYILGGISHTASPTSALQEIIRQAAFNRRVVDAHEDDIADPYSAGEEAHAQAFAQVREASARIAEALRSCPPLTVPR